MIRFLRSNSKMHSNRRLLPGHNLSLGISLLYLSLFLLIPLGALFLQSAQISTSKIIQVLSSERIWAACKISFGLALISALLNVVMGFTLAWPLARYSFPGKKILDTIIDLPLALPTAVAGISLASLYASNSHLGGFLESAGIQVAYSPLGIVIAMSFVGIPFAVRTVQPVIEEIDIGIEEAAATLGANWSQIFFKIILPMITPSLLAGFGLSFARAVGEYGSVIFIAGNIPYQTEIAPLLILSKLEQYDYDGAIILAMLMLSISFLVLLTVNLTGRFRKR